MKMKTNSCRWLVTVALTILILTVAAMPVLAQAQANKKIDQGRLKIVGKGIEHLVLVDKDGKRHEFGTAGGSAS